MKMKIWCDICMQLSSQTNGSHHSILMGKGRWKWIEIILVKAVVFMHILILSKYKNLLKFSGKINWGMQILIHAKCENLHTVQVLALGMRCRARLFYRESSYISVDSCTWKALQSPAILSRKLIHIFTFLKWENLCYLFVFATFLSHYTS